MSKHHIRADKTCLNCGTQVPDRFCPHCGQENLEPKESMVHLVIHFFNDVTHFDGKFFSTIKLLFTKPGFLSAEYMKGRRADYLNPIRMFLFISFALFFIEFATYDYIDAEDEHASKEFVVRIKTKQQKDSLQGVIAKSILADTLADQSADTSSGWLGSLSKNYATVHRYDSVQNTLPSSQRDNFFANWIARRFIGYGEYADNHKETADDDFVKTMMHAAPKALFLSIPIFAFILWLLYIRSRKNYYFVAHTIFMVHIYCAVYLFVMITVPLELFSNPVTDAIYAFAWIPPVIYLYIAMKRFYAQNHFKTAIKFVVMLGCSLAVLLAFTLGIAINAMYVLSQGGGH